MASALAFAALPARAALDIGERAPDFTAPASLAGQQIQFSLSDALKKGPVVVYFFPAAFSSGCSIEAHNFAEAIDEYNKLGATVIGVSGDDIDTQKRFSATECRGKFAVASDSTKAIMKSYDAVMTLMPDYANRISYVIVPEGKIVYQYTSLNPDKHVSKTLAALRDWLGRKVGDGRGDARVGDQASGDVRRP